MTRQSKVIFWQILQLRIYYSKMQDQLSTTCSNILKQHNWELLVAVDDNQLRTMASETVDPINWSHPPPSWAVPPELHVMHGVNAAYKSQDLCSNRGSNTRPWVCQTNVLFFSFLSKIIQLDFKWPLGTPLVFRLCLCLGIFSSNSQLVVELVE